MEPHGERRRAREETRRTGTRPRDALRRVSASSGQQDLATRRKCGVRAVYPGSCGDIIDKVTPGEVSLARRLRQGERMGNRTTSKRRRGLRTVLPVVAALMLLLATAPDLSAQEAPGGFPAGTAPEVAPGTCAHAPGEFLVGYTSEEAFQAAPTENVVGTFPEILAQHLAFPEVAGDPAAEEAKRQELSAQPGVAYAEYNCAAQVNQAAALEAAPKAASAPPPAICANCGKYVVEKARKILDDESEGKEAYDAALDAARTTDADGNGALASKEDADSAGGNSDTWARSEETGSEE